MFVSESALLDQLSNFYKDFSFDTNDFLALFEAYVKTTGMVEDYVLQVKDNVLISSLEAYRNIPFQVVAADSALYKLEEFLYDRDVARSLNIEGKSFTDRLKVWEGLDDSIRVQILTSKSKYIALSARRNIDLFEPKILMLDMYNLKNEQLSRNIDYILQDNNVYLLNKDISTPGLYNSKLILKNIVVDYNVAETFIGKNIGLLDTGVMTKPEYRNFVQMATYALLGGPTIYNIKNALETLSGLDKANIIDMYSAAERSELWSSGKMQPFDFLVSIPVEYFNNEDKLALFDKFLKIIKPAYTRYVIAWSQHIEEKTPLFIERIDTRLFKAKPLTLSGTDKVTTRSYQRDKYIMEMKQGEILQIYFDEDYVFYDSGIIFDTLDQLIFGRDAQGFGDVASLKHITFPEVPLQFSANRDIMTGYVNISFKDNAINTTRYEVMRNDIIITTKASNGSGQTVTLSDNINPLSPGNYIYYVRSVFEPSVENPLQTRYSLPSKRITIVR